MKYVIKVRDEFIKYNIIEYFKEDLDIIEVFDRLGVYYMLILTTLSLPIVHDMIDKYDNIYDSRIASSLIEYDIFVCEVEQFKQYDENKITKTKPFINKML